MSLGRRSSLVGVTLLLAWLGCSAEEAQTPPATGAEAASVRPAFAGSPVFEIQDESITLRPPPSSDRRAFFGDLHVHTTYSFDAFAFGTLATPYDAYRYAKGEVIQHPAGFDVQLRQPLDFYAVTDHAMFLGVAGAAADTSTEFSKLDVAEPFHDLNAPDNKGLLSLAARFRAFGTFLPNLVTGVR